MRLLQAQAGLQEANLADVPVERQRAAETHETAQQRAAREARNAETAATNAASDRARQDETRNAAITTMSELIRSSNPGLSDEEVRTRAMSAIGGGPNVIEEARETEDRTAQRLERDSVAAARRVTTAMNELRLNAEREAQEREREVRKLMSESFFRKHVESAARSGETGLPPRVAAAMAELGYKPDIIQEAFEAHAAKVGGVRTTTRGAGGSGVPVTQSARRLRAQQSAHKLITDNNNDPALAKAALEGMIADLQQGGMSDEDIGIIAEEIDRVLLNAMRGATRGSAGSGSAFEDAATTAGEPVP